MIFYSELPAIEREKHGRRNGLRKSGVFIMSLSDTNAFRLPRKGRKISFTLQGREPLTATDTVG